MPAVIKAYLESNNFSKALQIQKQLILDYEEDVKKYSTGVEQKKILEVYRSIPAQLAKEFKNSNTQRFPLKQDLKIILVVLNGLRMPVLSTNVIV